MPEPSISLQVGRHSAAEPEGSLEQGRGAPDQHIDCLHLKIWKTEAEAAPHGLRRPGRAAQGSQNLGYVGKLCRKLLWSFCRKQACRVFKSCCPCTNAVLKLCECLIPDSMY
mmetsp:Transcript_7062/g.11119  ORF Transcript_7062/g.11119 Transcript_7062/m.11119 type:complete len:112 (+) Transcript_7062:722-1057(+)